jgi:DHA3 family macrolide efflux protein-like MFS transporter
MTAQENSNGSHGWMAPFFLIWSGQAASLLGSQLVQFALIWWLTQTTGSATVLATAVLVSLLPQIVLGPLAGAIVDRWNRRLVMMLADSLIALATVGLAVLFWTGVVQVWHVYALMLLRSAFGLFHWSAMQASTSLMVPKEHLSRIQGLNQMLNGVMNIGSAPLGALLLLWLPMQGILAIDIVTAAIAVTCLFFVAIPQPERRLSDQSGESKTGLWQDVGDGLRYVWAWPGLMLIAGLATLINLLLNPTNALQPLLVTNHFHGGAFQLAWMESAWGVGVVVGGLTLSAWGGFRRRVVTSLVGIMVLGAGMAALGMIPASGFWVAVAVLFVVGFTGPMIDGPLFAVLQSVVAPEMQGRVFLLVISMAKAISPLGLIIAGPLADRFGVQIWFLAGGILTGVLGAAALLIPAIVNIEEERKVQLQATESADSTTQLAAASVELSGD